MRIGLLAWEADEEESHGLREFGRERGHEMTLFTLDDIGLKHTSAGSEVTVRGEPARGLLDLVLARPELRPGHVEADYELFSLLAGIPGVRIIDPPEAYLAAECKLVAIQRMAAAGLPVAPTRSCASYQEVTDAFAAWGRIVLKPTYSFGGTDVERVFDLDGDAPLIERLLARYQVLACQPYLEHPRGDVRVTVVGDDLPLTCRRIPPGGERWRANVRMGAAIEVIDTPLELADVAREAARAAGITVAGVDFLDTEDGYQIAEINNTPGWYPFSPADKLALHESIFKMFEASYPEASSPRGLR
jgi:ribosomal protein S6--L-glutamate ligase